MPLDCPACGRTGTADVTENDGWSFVKGDRGRRIHSLPAGYVVIKHGESHGEQTIIQCACGALIPD